MRRGALGNISRRSVSAALRAVALAVAALTAPSCHSSQKCAPLAVTTAQACSTQADCNDAGYTALACVNGFCRRTCTGDGDCSIQMLSANRPKGCAAGTSTLTYVCESELCVQGCSAAVPCPFPGEQCVDSRCVLYQEGFEKAHTCAGKPPPAADQVVTLQAICWNDIPEALSNSRTRVVFTGSGSCSSGDDSCAGPAAEGVRFLVVQRVPTPAVGTADSGSTCRPCACCLECQLNPPSTAPDPASCPSGDAPPVYACATSTPAVCRAVCDQCSHCPAQTATVGVGLLSCEVPAAKHDCTACASYDRCIARSSSTACASLSGACTACRDAQQCMVSNPGSSTCNVDNRRVSLASLIQACNAAGDDCFSTPIHRARSQLTEDEQATVSSTIALQGVTGNVVLELQYVPFDIHATYRQVVQGVPPSSWQVMPQAVKVQFCAGQCDQTASWKDATLADDSPAAFPPSNERDNGLSFGSQTSLDWRSGRLEVPIPPAFRTTAFRFRLVPQLADSGRVGIDNISIRRRQ